MSNTDPAVDEGAGTHAAGLQRHIEGGVEQAIVFKLLARFPKRHHLGMGTGVVLADGAIPPLCHYLVPQHQHGTDRDLAYPLRPGRQGHGMTHPVLVLPCLIEEIIAF